MILYNVTIGIDKDIEKEWLSWMKNDHIPRVMGIGIFVENKIFKVISQPEEENPSYSIQYFAKSIGEVDEYLKKFAPALQQEMMDKYKGKHVAFRTLLESA